MLRSYLTRNTTDTRTTWFSTNVSCQRHHGPLDRQSSRRRNTALTLDGDQLYNGVKTLVAEHLERLADQVIVPTFPRSGGTLGAGRLGGGAEAVERGMEGDRFLKALKSVWDDHTGSMRKLKDVLKYMVRLLRSEFIGGG